MKKCPRCMKSDHDTVRFCRYCNTELFFLERFAPEEEKPEKRGIIKRLFTKIK
jgi:hypothetical protein